MDLLIASVCGEGEKSEAFIRSHGVSSLRFTQGQLLKNKL